MRGRLAWGLGIGLAAAAALGIHLSSNAGPRNSDQAPMADGAIPGIVFVGAPIFDEETDGGQGVYQGSFHWRDGYVYPRSATYHRGERTMGPTRPGRNLYALVPAALDGKLTRLTHLKSGSVFKPSPSYDGSRVLFAMRRDGEDWFHLHEIAIDGSGLRQLTDGPFNDFGGAYLPDGRIVFCSDRTGYLEEYHEERTEALFVMNGDGSGIQQLTFLPGTYFEPSVMQDGRILFSFWDAFHIDVPPFDKHETFLMTVNPDGTEERHLFGAGQYRFFNRERHSSVGLTQAREMPDGRILCQSEMGPSIIDLRAGMTMKDALTPIFPGTTSIQVGGTTHRVHLSPLGTRSTPYPLADGRFLFSRTEPGARDSAICVADPATRAEKVILNIPNYAEFDAVPVGVQRPRPAVLPARNEPKKETTRFLVVAGRESDNPERAQALKRARWFRVVEAEYTGVTTSSHTNLETRILGTVPILPDGSAWFEAPADTPIFLDPIDAGGNRVLMDWSYLNTSVAAGLPYPATQMAYMSGRAGETKSCYGCHAPQTDAVPNTALLALKYGPVKVTRESTDLQYRRNEPEAYRRQARIGEQAKYLSWLKSQDPSVRARGCEMLMHLDADLVRVVLDSIAMPADKSPCIFFYRSDRDDMDALVQLLRDDSVEVRRAAAMALSRLATRDEARALKTALADVDWQVRFAAAVALEALGETDALKGEPLAFTGAAKSFEALGREPLRAVPNWRLAPPPDAIRKELYAELARPVPEIHALQAAGKLQDRDAVIFLYPWLRRHEWEYHAAEAAVALGRIGTPDAVHLLWQAVRNEVPNRKVHISRYLQQGPRPEEYALLKGLLLAKATTEQQDVHLLIAMLPNTFMEKPRFEDRLRSESQRILMPRLLLENAPEQHGDLAPKPGFRARIVAILMAALRGQQQKDEPLYEQVLKGINLERPFSEHGRPFPVVTALGAEEALWLLGCLIDPEKDLRREQDRPPRVDRGELERLVVPFLTSQNHRERIDAAVLLGLVGFGPRAADALAAQIAKPYSFPEIASIGKGMPDENFRDKAYFVQALARHMDDVGKVKQFADPKTMTRDVRYGLTHGLAFRGKADGIPLLIEMATRDPITLIRQQARHGIADIQDACRLAGRPVPEVVLPEPQPLEALYPPRGLKWTDTQFEEFRRKVEPLPNDAAALDSYLTKCLAPGNFRNLNMGQVTGAQRMMIRQVDETRRSADYLAALPSGAARKTWVALLDSPYPYAHYLAGQVVAERRDPEIVPTLLGKLEGYLKAQDLVGFWWCCEALGSCQAREALPLLARHAVPSNPPGTFGPPGMAIGYVAARALARIAADPKQTEVARCLAHDNVWLRAGALRGLAEARAPGVEGLLEQAAAEENPALVRHEAQVQLRLMREQRERN